MSLNTILTIRTPEIREQKWNVEVGLSGSRAEKTLHQRNKWRQWFDRGTVITSPKFQTRILHFKSFGQDF